MPDLANGVIPQRASGILLHPTSLPGRFAIGDIGSGARSFIDQLAQAKQQYWQVLPLGPTGYGDSPYQCFSAFAGNPTLISPEDLLADRLLTAGDLENLATSGPKVIYSQVIQERQQLLQTAWERFQRGDSNISTEEFQKYQTKNQDWLLGYAVFMAIKSRFGGGSWHDWPQEYRQRDLKTMNSFRKESADLCSQIQFEQFLFDRQWQKLRSYAKQAHIHLIGDMPIFIAEDSADVWEHPELFTLDEQLKPKFVAGVPPDYFSRTGQRWGNPQYNWAAHQKSQYAWWTRRVQVELTKVDVIRLDHFRGFAAAWEIPAHLPTAETGRWAPGPGAELLNELKRALGKLPLIAEDLGVITDDVNQLRTGFHLPGMRILQFAFGGAVESRFLPHNYENPTVCYTGTHDNDTSLGWYQNNTPDEQLATRQYLRSDGQEICWDLIHAAWASIAQLAICPVQDLLSLGSEARMNTPGQAQDNWTWRLTEPLPARLLDRLAEMTTLYERVLKPKNIA